MVCVCVCMHDVCIIWHLHAYVSPLPPPTRTPYKSIGLLGSTYFIYLRCKEPFWKFSKVSIIFDYKRLNRKSTFENVHLLHTHTYTSIYINIDMHAYTRSQYIHIYTHIHIHACIHTHTLTFTHTHTHLKCSGESSRSFINTYIYTHTCIHLNICMHTHTHTYIHFNTCIHTHAHTHTTTSSAAERVEEESKRGQPGMGSTCVCTYTHI